MRIKQNNCAAVIIDIQERLYPFIHEHEKLTQQTTKLIQGLNVLEIPLIVTQQYTKGIGETISPIKDAIGEFEHIEKMTFSCCGEETFMDALTKLNKKNVILTGIETHVCVLQTAIDLIEHGFTPILIEDCVSSRSANDKRIAVERMRVEGAIISTMESILFELTEVSGTPRFKSIVKIVK